MMHFGTRSKGARNRWLGLFLLLSGSWSVAAKTLALLVGVGSHDDPKIPDLACVGPDISMMRRTLIDSLGVKPEDVLILTNRQATASAVTEAFQRHLVDGASASDSVLFYFTGHGSQVRDDNGDEEDGLDEVLVTYGTRWEDPTSYISDDSLKIWLDRLRCRKAVVVLDCCHSGTGTRTMQRVPIKTYDIGFSVEAKGHFPFLPRQNGFQRVNASPGTQRALVAACAANETALGPSSGSLLTREFCQQIRFANARPLSEIMKSTSAKVVQEARRLAHQQSPQLEGDTDVILPEERSTARPPAARPAPPTAATPANSSPPRESVATTPQAPDPVAPPLPAAPTIPPLPPAPTTPPEPSQPAGDSRLPLLDERIQRMDFAMSMRVVDAETGQSVAGREVRAGTRLQVRVNVGKAGHLRLFHFDSSLASTMVYPNQYQSNGIVSANREILIPGPEAEFDFVVTDDSIGVETLKAVCSTVPFEERLDPPAKGSPFFGQVPLLPSESYRRGLAVQPRVSAATRVTPSGPEVAEAVVAYRVVK